MANNGHKTPIFPSNPITLVSKNHHLSVFISDISSFPMVPMAMKPYKTLIFARSITIFGRKKTHRRRAAPGIGCLGEVKQHRQAVYRTWPDNHII